MHNDIATIHQHPLTGTFAFGADNMKAGFLYFFDHVIRERFGLPR